MVPLRTPKHYQRKAPQRQAVDINSEDHRTRHVHVSSASDLYQHHSNQNRKLQTSRATRAMRNSPLRLRVERGLRASMPLSNRASAWRGSQVCSYRLRENSFFSFRQLSIVDVMKRPCSLETLRDLGETMCPIVGTIFDIHSTTERIQIKKTQCEEKHQPKQHQFAFICRERTAGVLSSGFSKRF